jgi:acid phosphatase type 7
MYEAGVDVILSGHSHHYERFAPLNPAGVVDYSRGIRSFMVGTGGASLAGLQVTRANGRRVMETGTYGVIRLILHSSAFTWDFLPISDRTFADHGTAMCH